MNKKKKTIVTIVVALILGFFCYFLITQKSVEVISNNNTRGISANFYDLTTSKFVDGSKLPADYTVEKAKSDGCYVIDATSSYNENLYEDFMIAYNRNASSFMRIINVQDDNKFVIYDVKFNYKVGSIFLAVIHKYDGTSKDTEYYQYAKIGTYITEDQELLLLYNDSMTTLKRDGNTANYYQIGVLK